MQYDYNYNRITKEYMNKTESKFDPLESNIQKKEVYLNPLYSTKKEPGVNKENEVYIFEDDEWKIIPDFRNEKFYIKDTKEEIIIKTIGEIPEILTDKKPIDTDIWDIDTNNWIEDSKLTEEKENDNKKLIIEEKIQEEIRKIAITNLTDSGDLTKEDLILINDSIPIVTKV